MADAQLPDREQAGALTPELEVALGLDHTLRDRVRLVGDVGYWTELYEDADGAPYPDGFQAWMHEHHGWDPKITADQLDEQFAAWVASTGWRPQPENDVESMPQVVQAAIDRRDVRVQFEGCFEPGLCLTIAATDDDGQRVVMHAHADPVKDAGVTLAALAAQALEQFLAVTDKAGQAVGSWVPDHELDVDG